MQCYSGDTSTNGQTEFQLDWSYSIRVLIKMAMVDLVLFFTGLRPTTVIPAKIQKSPRIGGPAVLRRPSFGGPEFVDEHFDSRNDSRFRIKYILEWFDANDRYLRSTTL